MGMQAQMEAELDPAQREARILRQQQFMKWRLGGKEDSVEDEEFKEMEQEEEKNSWKKVGWRDWKTDNAASTREKKEWENAGWVDFSDDSMGKSTDSGGWKDWSKEKSGWQDWNK